MSQSPYEGAFHSEFPALMEDVLEQSCNGKMFLWSSFQRWTSAVKCLFVQRLMEDAVKVSRVPMRVKRDMLGTECP